MRERDAVPQALSLRVGHQPKVGAIARSIRASVIPPGSTFIEGAILKGSGVYEELIPINLIIRDYEDYKQV